MTLGTLHLTSEVVVGQNMSKFPKQDSASTEATSPSAASRVGVNKH